MKRSWRIGLFVVLILLQCGVVGQMIYGREALLKQGQAFRFKTAPIDPVDPFRGRYVTLRLEADSAPVPDWQPGSKTYAFVRIVEGEDGFAQLGEVLPAPPADKAYLKLRVSSVRDGQIRFTMPFNRYYAEETVAPEIERAYVRNSRREKQKAWIVLRVLDGKGAIEDLYIDGLPVADYLRREANRTP